LNNLRTVGLCSIVVVISPEENWRGVPWSPSVIETANKASHGLVSSG